MLPIDNFDVVKSTKLDRILPLVDVFFVARKEAKQIAVSDDPEFAGQKLVDMGCKTGVLKQGKNGCVIKTKDKTVQVEGYKIKAYDTVGSGDIYGASYSYGLLNNWSTKQIGEFPVVFTALRLGEYKEYKEYPDIQAVKI